MDGVLIKENLSMSDSETGSHSPSKESNAASGSNNRVVTKKTGVCYYVMKLAEYGELYRFVEHTERFSEPLAKSLFIQLIEGLQYLHS